MFPVFFRVLNILLDFLDFEGSTHYALKTHESHCSLLVLNGTDAAAGLTLTGTTNWIGLTWQFSESFMNFANTSEVNSPPPSAKFPFCNHFLFIRINIEADVFPLANTIRRIDGWSFSTNPRMSFGWLFLTELSSLFLMSHSLTTSQRANPASVSLLTWSS